MKRSRYNEKSKKTSLWIWLTVTVVVLAGAITTFWLLTNDQQAVPKQEEKPDVQTQQQPTEVEPVKVEVDEAGYALHVEEVTEPTYIDGVLIANKKYPLPKDYNKGVDPEAQQALDVMVAAAEKEGFQLTGFSSFRSYEYQTKLYNNYVAKDGKANADRYSARPGNSEHQTGLAFDIGEVGREDLWLTEEFGETKAGKWLHANAHKYGFILRYPKGKEEITGFMYESWHFRYLGEELAGKVFKANVTLEEYLHID